MSGPFLELKNLKKSFTAGEAVLSGISLTIEKGEFVTLLGASGCGKTTTLRIIAGLEQPDEGSVWLEGQNVTDLEPNQRDVNTVFQNYALFPHMNVADNIGYGLKIRKVPKAEIREKVKKMLELVQLEGFEKRKPSELSGGQRQRVAIARALANNPRVLLLDEPLGALDLQLRRTMQLELKRLQKKLGITFIYITHDQEEAINMSDRIVVMNRGRFEQIGTPDKIYNHPKTSYVATFVGNANILKGSLVGMEGTVALRRENVLIEEKEKGKTGTADTTDSIAGDVDVRTDRNSRQRTLSPSTRTWYPATVKEKNFAAGQLRVLLVLSDGTELTASRFGMNANIQPGQQVRWSFDPRDAVIVDRDEKQSEENGTNKAPLKTSPSGEPQKKEAL